MIKLKTTEKDPIAKEGYPFIVLPAAAGCFLRKKGWRPLACAAFAASMFSAYFFRNPRRNPPAMEGAIISPADGVVISKGRAYERYFFKKEVDRISIFMSLFDVHINRSPVDGEVVDVIYNRGKYLPAYREKASMDNEQNALLIDAGRYGEIVVVQIAGLVARRIVCYKRGGDAVESGEIIGLIRFGSRVDVYVEKGMVPLVDMKEKVKAGETILGVVNGIQR